MNKIQTPGRHPLSIPVKGGQPIEGVRLVGNQPGKTLVVTAGVHGDEYVGIQAVRELLAQLSPGELSGQVIFVPVVNAGGFFAGTYRGAGGRGKSESLLSRGQGGNLHLEHGFRPGSGPLSPGGLPVGFAQRRNL